MGVKPKIVVAQLGARRHYAVPVLLHQEGMLAQFFTDAYVGRGSAWQELSRLAQWLPPACRRRGQACVGDAAGRVVGSASSVRTDRPIHR